MRGRSNSFNDDNDEILTHVSLISYSDDEIKDDFRHQQNIVKLKFQNKLKTREKKKILVLDLDDTLIHTINASYDENQFPQTIENPSKIQLKLKLDEPLKNLLSKNHIKHNQNYYPVVYNVIYLNYCHKNLFVCERPKVREFLQKVCELFEVFIYTSSDKRYAKPIIDSLCPMIDESHRKYGHLCLVKHDRIYKDLFMFNRQFSDILIVDDNRENLFFWPRNTIVCKKFSLNFEKYDIENDSEDDEQNIVDDNTGLLIDQNYLMNKLLPILEKCESSNDVREVIQKSKKLIHFYDDQNVNSSLSFIESPKPLF